MKPKFEECPACHHITYGFYPSYSFEETSSQGCDTCGFQFDSQYEGTPDKQAKRWNDYCLKQLEDTNSA